MTWLGLEEMGLPSLVGNGKRYFHQIPLSPLAAERATDLEDLGL